MQDITKKFLTWGVKQLNTQNRLYQPKVISNYKSALNTIFATNKLGILSDLNGIKSIFECTDSKEFQKIYDTIINHPRYNFVNSASNNNLSSALKLYIRFLEYINNGSGECYIEEDFHTYNEERLKKANELSDKALQQKVFKVKKKEKRYCQVISRELIRDPIVAIYTLKRAKGICDFCQQPAPFIKKDGSPYLEVHHIKWLSRGGADSIDNTLALCPNCHRKAHILDDLEIETVLKDRIDYYKSLNY